MKPRHGGHGGVVPEVLRLPRDGKYGHHFIHCQRSQKMSNSCLKQTRKKINSVMTQCESSPDGHTVLAGGDLLADQVVQAVSFFDSERHLRAPDDGAVAEPCLLLLLL